MEKPKNNKIKSAPSDAILAALPINVKHLGRLLGRVPRPSVTIQYRFAAQLGHGLGGQEWLLPLPRERHTDRIEKTRSNEKKKNNP